jgi:peptidoglycan/xylan/chitin deacetylase (PgdA/CDA1 family)
MASVGQRRIAMDYLASYDLESVDMCVPAGGAVAALHREFRLPATFFVVGRCLEKHGSALRAFLDDELFDVQSHTYSHKTFRAIPGASGGDVDVDVEREIAGGVRCVEETFGRRCIGLRTGCGYDGGLTRLPDVLRACAAAGLEYVSSDLRGPGDTLPSPLKKPYTYGAHGYPGLWELPVHGWHDNVLKGFCPRVGLVAYPPAEDWHLPPAAPKSPAEQAAHHLVWVDRAREAGLPFVSIAFHPWSVFRYDPSLTEQRLIFEGLARRGVRVSTCTDAWRALRDRATRGVP